jgi:PAS domain S-box-containing protein
MSAQRPNPSPTPEFLAAVVECSDDAIITKHLNGLITSWNNGAERIFGYTAEEMIGQPISILAAPNRTDEMPLILSRIRNGERVDHYQTIRKTKDHRLVNISLTVSPIKDAEGRIIGASKIARDITERVRAAERVAELNSALRKSEAEARQARDWLSTTLRSIGDAVIATDESGTVTLLNSTAETLTGWKQEEAIGRELEDVFIITNEETGATVENPVSKALRLGHVVGLANHTRLTSKDGREISIDDSAAPIRDAAGVTSGVVLVFRDVTEKRIAEKGLARVQKQLEWELAGTRGLHELGGRLMAVGDLPSVLNEILAAAEKITGADKGNIQLLDVNGALRIESQHGFSKEFLDFFHTVENDDASCCAAALSRRERIVVEDVERSAIFAGSPSLKVLRADGVRAVQSTPIISSRGVILGMLSTHYRTARQPTERDLRLIDILARQAADLIEKARADEELRDVNQALLRANEDLNQFAFATSHDLQSPMRMITTYSQLLLKRSGDQLSEETSRCVEFISEGTNRMRELLADLLAYTQLSSDAQEQIESIDLNLVFRKVLENCKATIDESSASVTSDYLPRVNGYEPHFVQVFQNLISNALKYRGQQTPRIHVSAMNESGMWRLAVADNGIGIDPIYHRQIFGVFKRLHDKTIPGTGMGLAICQRVVERYGGRIWVQSQANQGATFYFTLPTAAVTQRPLSRPISTSS